MNVTITPRPLAGAITPPPSKSQAHRVVIAACLSDGVCHLKNLALSADIAATLACMRALGADASADGAVIQGANLLDVPHCRDGVLDCGESGSTLRFLIPLALALRGEGKFIGRGRLMERPQEPYFQLFEEKGISYTLNNGQLAVAGKLAAGVYHLRGDVSSQFVTGLLYALPLLDGDSEIHITTPLESRGYVDMTLEVLAQFGVTIECDGDRIFRVAGGQRYRHCDAVVERDYSQAGFFYAARGLGSNLSVEGLNPNSAQGDKIIVEYAALLDGAGEVVLDVSQCPDLVPALAARAALRAGEVTRIINAQRLRIKESDRLDTVATQLGCLGAGVEQGADFLVIRGVPALTGGTVSACNDHRIAMMLAVAATRATGMVTITGADCVRKSYPNFWEDYQMLGGQVTCDT